MGKNPGLPVPNSTCGLCGRKATFTTNFFKCEQSSVTVKIEVAVLGSLSLIVLMVSVDVKRHLKKTSANFASAFLSFSSTSSVQFSSTWGGFSGSGKACIIGTQSQSGKNVPNISWNLINYMYKVLIITVLNETVMAGNTSFLMSLVHTGLRATKY